MAKIVSSITFRNGYGLLEMPGKRKCISLFIESLPTAWWIPIAFEINVWRKGHPYITKFFFLLFCVFFKIARTLGQDKFPSDNSFGFIVC